MTRLQRKAWATLQGIAALLLTPARAAAHTEDMASGFMAGLTHPLFCPDHLLAMVAVGILSSQLGGRHLWRIPAVFVLGMIRRASSYLSPPSCSYQLNFSSAHCRGNHGVSFRVEGDGRDVRPIVRAEERPLAWLNCLGDERDLVPLAEGVRPAWRLLQQPELRSSFQQLLAWTDSMIGSDRALHQALRRFVRPAAHLGGPARMGGPLTTATWWSQPVGYTGSTTCGLPTPR